MTKTVVDRSRNITHRKHKQTKYQKFVRKAIRRKSCSYMLITNFIILMLIILSILLSIVVIYTQKQAIVGYLREEQLIASKKKTVTFQQCQYDELGPWYSEFCYNNAGNNNILWRERRLKSSNLDRRCSDQLETVPCHLKSWTNLQRLNITECPGLHPQPFHHFDSQIIASAVNETQLEITMMFRAYDLVVYCPVCRVAPKVAFQSADSDASCYYRLTTTKFGWPSLYQFCDPFSLIKDDGPVNCTEFKASFSFDPFDDIDKE
ncbi:hypothetical protein M3Y95_01145800 [Aphelenchoides besseyi]|nr:hypothetical protein M3Y95_01145800 [Aphelenchoides besseyi]